MRLLLQIAESLLMATSRHSAAQNRLLLYPQQRTFGLGQIQAPTCRRRNGLADIIKVAGIGLVHVALVNERRNQLAGHLDRHHETALLAAGAVAALAARGEIMAWRWGS